MRGCYLLRHLGVSISSITGHNTKAKKRTCCLRHFILFYDLPSFVVNSEFDFYVLCLALLETASSVFIVMRC